VTPTKAADPLELKRSAKSRMSFLSASEKKTKYDALVQARRLCRACVELVNPSVCQDGAFDSDAIGPWSTWQGNLDALVMVIGQDLGRRSLVSTREGSFNRHVQDEQHASEAAGVHWFRNKATERDN
jgi:hypothetical protein